MLKENNIPDHLLFSLTHSLLPLPLCAPGPLAPPFDPADPMASRSIALRKEAKTDAHAVRQLQVALPVPASPRKWTQRVALQRGSRARSLAALLLPDCSPCRNDSTSDTGPTAIRRVHIGTVCQTVYSIPGTVVHSKMPCIALDTSEGCAVGYSNECMAQKPGRRVSQFTSYA